MSYVFWGSGIIQNIKTAWRLGKLITGSAYYIARLHLTNDDAKAEKLVQRATAFMLKTLGVTVNVTGKRADKNGKPVYFMPNHISYVDAVIVMNQLDHTRFVTSKDAEKWPVLGKVARRLNFAFVDRVRTRIPDDEKKKIVDRICDDLRSSTSKGHNLLVFPEGGLSDGSDVLRYRPGTFGVFFPNGTADDGIIAQPIAIEIKSVGGKPVPAGTPSPLREVFARYGVRDANGKRKISTPVLKHVWRLAATADKGGVEVNVHFSEPLTPSSFKDGKEMSEAAREKVRAVLHRNKPPVAA